MRKVLTTILITLLAAPLSAREAKVAVVMSKTSYGIAGSETGSAGKAWTAVANLAGLPYETLFVEDLKEEALDAYTLLVLSQCIYLTEAEYTLNVKVWIGQYEGVADAANAAIAEYALWQDNTVGRAFNPDKLTAMLYQAGCERVQFTEGSGMSGAEAPEYTEIGDDERCKGTITLTVVIA